MTTGTGKKIYRRQHDNNPPKIPPTPPKPPNFGGTPIVLFVRTSKESYESLNTTTVAHLPAEIRAAMGVIG